LLVGAKIKKSGRRFDRENEWVARETAPTGIDQSTPHEAEGIRALDSQVAMSGPFPLARDVGAISATVHHTEHQMKASLTLFTHRDPSTTKLYDRRGYNPEKAASFFATC